MEKFCWTATKVLAVNLAASRGPTSLESTRAILRSWSFVSNPGMLDDFSAANWNIFGSQTETVTAVNNAFKQIVCYVAGTIILTFFDRSLFGPPPYCKMCQLKIEYNLLLTYNKNTSTAFQTFDYWKWEEVNTRFHWSIWRIWFQAL